MKRNLKPKFYTIGSSVLQAPVHVKKKDGTYSVRMGFIVCGSTNDQNAKEIARALNGTRAKRVIGKLLRGISQAEKFGHHRRLNEIGEQMLVPVLEAEKFLKEGP